MRLSRSVPFIASSLLLAGLASMSAPSIASAAVSDMVPAQSSCDNGSVTVTWQSLGLDRPVVASLTVDGETVPTPETPADGGIGVAVCAEVANARKVGVYVIRRSGSNYHRDLTGAVTPSSAPITNASNISITFNDLGDNARYLSFALVHGKVQSWNTSGLGTDSATLSFTAKPARFPVVDFSAPGASLCSATPPVCDVAQSGLDIMTVGAQLDMDPARAFASFAGSYFGLDGAISGFVQAPPGGGLSLQLGAPHFRADGTTRNEGAMQLFLPTATLEAVLGLAPGAVDTDDLSVTRSEGGTTSAAPFTVTPTAGGVVIAITGVTFSAPTYTVKASGGRGFTPVVPERLLNTREVGQKGYTGAKPAAGTDFPLQVTGIGTANVPADAKAVVLNVTAVDPTAAGFVTVHPCVTPRPNVSNLNIEAGVTRPNQVTVKLDSRGRVCFYTERGTHLLADIAGYYPADSDLTSVSPERILDTRPPSPTGYTGSKPVAGDDFGFSVIGGTAQVPSDATTVVLNLTGVDPTETGFVTVYPCGQPRPDASNLNLVKGVTAPNQVIVRVGTNGRVCIYTERGAHFIADIAGYFRSGSSFTSVTPERLLNTRPVGTKGYSGEKPGAGARFSLQVTGVGTANVPVGTEAVVLNVTGVDPTDDGYVTVYPCTSTPPDASNLNLRRNVTQPNLVTVKLSADGKVCFYSERGTHLLADIAGYYAR